MPEREWWIAAVQLSDSFHQAVSALAEELNAGVVAWRPDDGATLPAGAGVLVIMAGGAESAGLDLLAELGPGDGPRYLVGALPDHRIAAAAVRRGAEDYFVLPADLGLLRRALEREAREARQRVEAGRFADLERKANGFDSILGRSPILRQSLGQAARVATHHEAESAAAQAIRHAEVVDDVALRALTVTGRAELRVQQGEIAFAYQELDRAGRLAREAGDPLGGAEVMRVRALAALKEENYERAAAEAEAARAIALEHHSALLAAECSAAAALAYRRSGDVRRADEHLTGARAGLRELGAVKLVERLEEEWAEP
nr:hypothetical protein [Gemmatimonadales bacterium]